MVLNTQNSLFASTGTSIPDCTINWSKPIVFKVILFPPALGPEITIILFSSSGFTSFEEDIVTTGSVQVTVKITGAAQTNGIYKIHPFRKDTNNPASVDSCPSGTATHDLGQYAVSLKSTKAITLVGKDSIFGSILGKNFSLMLQWYLIS